MEQETIPELLQRIKAFYEKKAPAVLGSDWFEPATEAEVAEIEQELGMPLPAEFREFLLINDFAMLCEANFSLMKPSQILYRIRMMRDLVEKKNYNDISDTDKYDPNWVSGELKPLLWNTKWIPFALDSGGNMKCIDLDPGPQGILGQIVGSDVSEGPFTQGNDSFGSYLRLQWFYLDNYMFERVEEAGRVFIYMGRYY